MAGDTIDVCIKDGIVRVDVRNLIFKASKDKSVLDIQPLVLNVSVPAKFLGRTDDGGGERKLHDELQKRNLEKELRNIVADVQDKANREMAELGAKIRKELDKDRNDDKSAHKNAAKMVTEVVENLEDMTDGVPLSLREMIKKSGLFAKKSLSSIGTWGFPSGNRGIRLRPGTFKHVGKDDSTDAELRAAIKAAKGGGYAFVLVDSGPGGLVLRKRAGGSEAALAKEQAGGRGSALFGEIEYERAQDTFKFVLDKSCSESKCKNLANKIRKIVKERCNKNIKVWVTDEDRDDRDDESDPKVADSSGNTGAKE
jgi:hypothetical protein